MVPRVRNLRNGAPCEEIHILNLLAKSLDI